MFTHFNSYYIWGPVLVLLGMLIAWLDVKTLDKFQAVLYATVAGFIFSYLVATESYRGIFQVSRWFVGGAPANDIEAFFVGGLFLVLVGCLYAWVVYWVTTRFAQFCRNRRAVTSFTQIGATVSCQSSRPVKAQLASQPKSAAPAAAQSSLTEDMSEPQPKRAEPVAHFVLNRDEIVRQVQSVPMGKMVEVSFKGRVAGSVVITDDDELAIPANIIR